MHSALFSCSKFLRQITDYTLLQSLAEREKADSPTVSLHSLIKLRLKLPRDFHLQHSGNIETEQIRKPARSLQRKQICLWGLVFVCQCFLLCVCSACERERVGGGARWATWSKAPMNEFIVYRSPSLDQHEVMAR